jgi:hypothetical protein
MSLIIIPPLAHDIYTGERLDPAALEIGDRVAWIESGYGFYGAGQGILAEVVRLTRTQVVVKPARGSEHRFDRATGSLRGTYGVHLIHPADPRIVRLRVLSVARGACRDIETLARAATCKDIDTATGSLENIRTAVNAALDRMAKLLTANPNSLIEENGS